MSSKAFVYYFEDFCFDTLNWQLLKNGVPAALTAKSLEVLLILIHGKGRFVKKEEIIEQVWRDSFVEESNLTQHIYVLRKALGQTAAGNPFIETMPKRGYRFTEKVSVREIESDTYSLSETGQSANQPAVRPAQPPENIPARPETTAGYKFDDFKLDIRRRMLYRDSKPITLPAKVFDTLLYLVENSGELVKKDELMDKIWQDRFVEENNLTQKIFILRRVLGDNKDTHQYIVTVPGEGYVFVAPVSRLSVDADSAAPPENAGFEDKKIQTPTAAPLAVLPFKTLAPNGDEDFWGIGLADALITQLSRYRELVVRPTLSVLKFHEQAADLSELSRKLQISYLVEGIIQRFESRLKISVHLFEAETGGIVWAEDFISETVDFLESQNQISNRVSKAVALKLSLEPLPSENSLPRNFEAFQEYIKGKFYWNARTIEGLKKGIVHAQKALEIDPAFAMAYVGLADCYNLLAGQHSYLPPAEAFPKSKAASQNALEISGGNLAEAYTSLAFATFYYDRDRPLAAQYFQRALELKPNYPTAHHWSGEALAAEGRFGESIERLMKAQELDPLSSAISADLAHAFLLAGRVDESRLLLDRILEINPQFVRALYLYGLIDEQTGQFDEAVRILRQASKLVPDEPAVLAELGYAAGRSGDRDTARQIITDLEQIGKKRYLSGFLVAMIYLALGEHDEVFRWLEIARQNRDVWLAWVDVLPKLSELRKTPEFIVFRNKLDN